LKGKLAGQQWYKIRYLKNSLDKFATKMCNKMREYPKTTLFLLIIMSAVCIAIPKPLILIVSFLLTMFIVLGIGQIFLGGQHKINHLSGLWLGVTATIAVTTAFGALYGFLLVGDRYYEHFSFQSDSNSGKVITKKLANQFLDRLDYLTDEYGTQFESEGEFKNNPPNCNDQNDGHVNLDLGVLDNAKYNKKIVQLSIATAFREIYSNDTGNTYFSAMREYKYAVPYDYQSILNNFAARQMRTRYIPFDNWDYVRNLENLDQQVLLFVGDEIKPVIDYAVAYYIGQELAYSSQVCWNVEQIESEIGELTPGIIALFSSVIPEVVLQDFGLIDSQKYSDSELVFSSMLFSAMSVMTSGYSDMTPKSTLSRVLLVGQFLVYVLVILMIIPIGIERPRENSDGT